MIVWSHQQNGRIAVRRINEESPGNGWTLPLGGSIEYKLFVATISDSSIHRPHPLVPDERIALLIFNVTLLRSVVDPLENVQRIQLIRLPLQLGNSYDVFIRTSAFLLLVTEREASRADFVCGFVVTRETVEGRLVALPVTTHASIGTQGPSFP